MDRSILRRELLHLVHAPVFGERLVLQLVRQIGDGFRVKIVIGLSHQFGAVFDRIGQERHRMARRQDHVVAILDVNVIVGVLDQRLEAR